MSNVTTSSHIIIKGQGAERKAEEKRQLAQRRQQREIDFWKVRNLEDAQWVQKDMHVAKMLGTELIKKYPGHGWQVEADGRNGIVKIYNAHMSGIYGYILRMAEINWAELSTQMMRVGGELLRRFGVKNDVMNEDEILQKQKDFAGRARIDLS